MNYSLICKLLGNVLKYEAVFMIVALFVSLVYREDTSLSFVITILILLGIGIPLSNIKAVEKKFYLKEGFFAVALAWFVLSLFGALPFFFSGYFDNFMDCFFEAAAGFTTTGSTILTEIENIPKGILFWCSFTHWIGGMGVLVFMLAIMPTSASLFNLLKAESPGPSPSKLVPRIKDSAKILYTIYLIMTVFEIILLKLSGLPLFDSVIHSFGTAGTGGFSIKNLSVGTYNNVAAEAIITIFTLMFGINFSLYFYILKKDIKSFFKDEELRIYLFIVAISSILITFNIINIYGSFGKAFRYSLFQVTTLITTTGYFTTDYNLWPTFSKIILIILMFIGGCAGSTGGGVKVVRIIVLFKSVRLELNKLIHPRVVKTVKINGKNIDDNVLTQIAIFIFIYIMIFTFSTLIISLDNKDLVTSCTAVIASMSNTGHGFGAVGPIGNYSSFSILSKAVLSFCMIAGRLEFFPMMVLFVPSIWRENFRKL